MGLLIILFVLAGGGVVALTFLRPAAKERFRNPERGRLAEQIEHGGHIALGVAIVTMLLFGIGRSPSSILRFVWLILILGGFAAFALAHYIASRVHLSRSLAGARPATAPSPEPREPTRRPAGQTGPARPPSPERREPTTRRPAGQTGPARPPSTAGASGERRAGGASSSTPDDRPGRRVPAGDRGSRRPAPAPGGSPKPGGAPRRPEAGRAVAPDTPRRRSRPPEVPDRERTATSRGADPDRPAGNRPAARTAPARRAAEGRPDEPGAAPRPARDRRPRPRPPAPRTDDSPDRRHDPTDKANHESSPDDPTEIGDRP